MSGAASARPRHAREPQIWDFGLERYDRAPLFRPGEWEALDAVCTRSGKFHGQWPAGARVALERFLAPIRDMLPDTQVKSTYTRVYGEMHRRQKPYWAWSDEEWLESVRTTSGRNFPRAGMVACAYRLCGFRRIDEVEKLSIRDLVYYVFGREIVSIAAAKVSEAAKGLGLSAATASHVVGTLWCVMAVQGSPLLNDITEETLVNVQRNERVGRLRRKSVAALGMALQVLGVLKKPLAFRYTQPRLSSADLAAVAPEWAAACQTWRETSTYEDLSRATTYGKVLRIGLWLAQRHPKVTHPRQWDRKLCAEWVAVVNGARSGDWTFQPGRAHGRLGEPLSPRTRDGFLAATRVFFRDLQEWELIPIRFNPARALETPRAVRQQITPDPRDIEETVWLKLVWASLNLTEADLRVTWRGCTQYPLAFVRALAVLWTHTGLRSDELARFPLGGTREQAEDLLDPETGKVTYPAGTLCFIRVPANKTSGAFWKPVSGVVRQFVLDWEAERPAGQPQLSDRKTGQMTDFLFVCRGQRVSKGYLNESLIPVLARKAGVPAEDVRGVFTSHRGRASAATMLGNARQGMSLLELMQWLGHKSPHSTVSYLRVREATVARSFAAADQSARMIQVLIDQEAIRNGDAAAGLPWRYYDLGGSYCTYEFWSRCKHRMVCPGCTYNVPKASARGQALEANAFLMHVLEEVPLTDDERVMVEGGIEINNVILAKLAAEPTPDGALHELGHSPLLTPLVHLSYRRAEGSEGA